MPKKKYYFITFRGVRRDLDPSVSYWHDVTDLSPMEFRKELLDAEEESEKEGKKSYYSDFIIINTERITAEQFNEWEGHF